MDRQRRVAEIRAEYHRWRDCGQTVLAYKSLSLLEAMDPRAIECREVRSIPDADADQLRAEMRFQMDYMERLAGTRLISEESHLLICKGVDYDLLERFLVQRHVPLETELLLTETLILEGFASCKRKDLLHAQKVVRRNEGAPIWSRWLEPPPPAKAGVKP